MTALAPSHLVVATAGACLLTICALSGPALARQEAQPAAPAADAKSDTSSAAPAAEAEKEESYSIHGQATVVSQGNWKFRSPYEGPDSFLPLLNYRTTNTDTLYLDGRVWHGGEVVFNPEVSGGKGLSNTLGLAGFPNGEATRVGTVQPTPYVARLFFRQTIGLDGDMEKVEAGPNMLAGWRDLDRITFTVGKMAATDSFDDNRYSHDPRTQFLNRALMDTGAWDYPANVRGYTYGMTLDFNTRFFAARYGIFSEPTVAQGAEFDPHFLKANGHIVEFQERYYIGGHPGSVREWAYANHAHMGNYRDALAAMPVDPDITQTREYRFKYGFGLSADQEFTNNLGVFLRAGWNDGQSESWAFTEIDRTVAAGLCLKGALWSRPKDEAGLAYVVNGVSDAHKDYLAAGGIGFQIGDGRLNYGPEQILELYYNWVPKEWLILTADLQGVDNPAYNRDRGPIAIFGIRMHLAF